MKSGIELIAQERAEQVEKHGWNSNHDASHRYGELAKMAALLAVNGTDAKIIEQDEPYGDSWGLVSKLSKDRVHQLKVAGALIAAEIDRLQNH
jgi:hypothetical protein